MNHPWHNISIGSKAPNVVTCVIEIPQGTRGKYELDKDTGMIKLDRVLFTSMYYPANYGFLPQTYCEDGDPLDVLVFCKIDMQPMCLVDIRPIGVMHMTDNGEADDKILAVAVNDPNFEHIKNLSDLPESTLMEVKTFFEDYKKLEKKKVIIDGFYDIKKAHHIIEESIDKYKAKFN